MANVDTIKNLTDNMKTVLQGSLKMKVERQNLEDIKDLAASKFPLGGLFDKGSEYEYNHGQKAGYGIRSFLIWVVTKEGNNQVRMREFQEWEQLIRGALTVNALNIGDLASSKLVSWVETTDTDTEHREDGLSVLNYTVAVRYREL